MSRQRRTSGEIINATLLEIFLSFIFVFLAIAWFREAELNAAERARAAAEQAAMAGESATDSIREAWSAAMARASELEKERDHYKGLYLNAFRPECDGPLPLTVTLTAPGRWTVDVHTDGHGFRAGDRLTVRSGEFRQRFRSYRAAFDSILCQYRVNVQDTPAQNKDQYKAALDIIKGIFYVRELKAS